MKIAVVTCYFDPDYVRSLTLRAGFMAIEETEVIVVKNYFRGPLRFAEIAWKLLRVRFNQKPDVYVLSFRGQEILPLVLLVAGRQPVVFDEFIVPLAWATQENHTSSTTIRLQKFLARAFAGPYKQWLRRCAVILSDTSPDAELSANLSGISQDKYVVVPVGAEEALFTPSVGPTESSTDKFELFFCGNMRPLYGLGYVLEALDQLRDIPGLHLTVVGGGKAAQAQVAAAARTGRPASYESWVPFAELPDRMHQADLCLAGPYGDTPQASRVVTGKTYQILACASPALIGANQATADFTDKQDCLLVPRADASALAGAIRWAYDNREQLPAIGAAGRTLYEQGYSVSAISARLRIVLAKLA